MFELGNVKNERILRDFLQEWKVECRADNLVPMRFAIVPLHLSKVLRLPRRKSDAKYCQVIQNAAPVTQNHLRKPEDLMLQNATPLSGNQRPDLLTSLMNMSLVLRLPREIHLCRSSSNVPRPPLFLEMPQNPHVLLTFGRVENPSRLPHKTTLQRPKVARTCGVLCILISKYASRHNGVSTSKSAPRLRCFVHFDFELCFAPQWRTLFERLNFQKCSEAEVFCRF